MDYKKKVAECIKSQVDMDIEIIEKLIEIPPKIEIGDYAFPCFQLAKAFRKNPNIIAEELKGDLEQDGFKKIENLGPYLNFFIDKGVFIKNILEKIISEDNNYGDSKSGEGKTICIEYSSPNIVKPFHIGHLFSTVIGNSLYKLFKKGGYRVKRLNYLDDWGAKLGKLIFAYKRWGNEKALEKDVISEILRLYAKFHDEVEKDKSLEDEGVAYLKSLEEGNVEVQALWQRFRELSLKEFERIYDIFNVKFDSYEGKAFFNDKMDVVINELIEKGLLTESNGVQVVMLDKYNMPPSIVLRDDGVSISSIRDLTAAIHRKKVYDFYKCIYVVGAPQALYFKQTFKVLELAGHEWVKDCIHVGFGLVKFADSKLSTKEGVVVFLDDLIKESIDKTLEIINEKNPNLENKEEVAKKVGVGAIVFTCLKNPRERGIVFDWKEILSAERETALYIQYSYAKANSILTTAREVYVEANFNKLDSREEIELAKILESFGDEINNAIKKLEPSIITRYAIEVTNIFNKFYNAHSILNLEDKELMKARLVLVKATCQVIKNALELIGIEVVENM